jgi:uncharacterized damage-inducible protein DinB
LIMDAKDILLLNFEEIRRRSIKLWRDIPVQFYGWKPDPEAMTVMEMVRHILEAEHSFHMIVNNRGSIDFESPWKNRPYQNMEDEIAFSKPYRETFIDKFSKEDLETIEIYRPEKNQRRKLGDYLLRIACHEGVHTGQLLDYLRSAGAERPSIWD